MEIARLFILTVIMLIFVVVVYTYGIVEQLWAKTYNRLPKWFQKTVKYIDILSDALPLAIFQVSEKAKDSLYKKLRELFPEPEAILITGSVYLWAKTLSMLIIVIFINL